VKPYTYHRQDEHYWLVTNPSGLDIAQTRTWRTARKIADALNAQQVKP